MVRTQTMFSAEDMPFVVGKAVCLVVLLWLTGCVTDSGDSGYVTESGGVPEYMLVDSRFSSDTFNSILTSQEIVARLQQELTSLGCSTSISYPQDTQIKLTFSKELARGSVRVEVRSGVKDMVHTYKYVYRVNITDYPSTVEQDREVNGIADYLKEVFVELAVITTDT